MKFGKRYWMLRVGIAIPAIAAVLMWTFTALWIRPGLDHLLTFAVLLTGFVTFISAGFLWSYRKATGRVALCAGYLGLSSMALAGLGQAPTAMRALVTLSMLPVLWYWGRQRTPRHSR